MNTLETQIKQALHNLNHDINLDFAFSFGDELQVGCISLDKEMKQQLAKDGQIGLHNDTTELAVVRRDNIQSHLDKLVQNGNISSEFVSSLSETLAIFELLAGSNTNYFKS